MKREDAVAWLMSEEGGQLDFDGQYGNQCVDYFNYYYQFLTGRNPYSDGFTEDGAKDIWNVGTDLFDKIPNNPNDPNQLPQPGDILIYNGNWGHGYGHVEMVLWADQNSVTVSAQNSLGQYVATENRTWGNVVGALTGWLSYRYYTVDTPVPPVVVEPPVVIPEPPVEPPVVVPPVDPQPPVIVDPTPPVEPTEPPTVPTDPTPLPQPSFLERLIKFLPSINKTLVAILAFFTGLLSSLSDGVISTSEWVTIATLLMAVFGVYLVSNKKEN